MKKLHRTDSPMAMQSANRTFREYAPNSPEARARLIALALFADGRLDDKELSALGRSHVYARLGLSREAFFQVLYDFCSDLSATRDCDDNYLVTPEMMAGLFAEMTDPSERTALLGMIFDVIRSDGHLATREASFFWNAVDAWQLGPTQAPRQLWGRKLRRRPPAFAIAR